MAKKYIDVEKLKAEIERLYDGEAPKHDQQCDFDDGYFTGIGAISKLIDSLQQEQPEVDLDLEKEIRSMWEKCNPTDEGMGSEYAIISVEQFDAIVRHFYELGLNTRKEE